MAGAALSSNTGGARRTARTRRALEAAFLGLLFKTRYGEIRIADIIDRADVGRSTFYDHYRSKDDILLATMDPLLSVMAQACSPEPDTARLATLLAHFWENRRLARVVFGPPLDALITRTLARKTLTILAGGAQSGDDVRLRIAAVQLASGQVAILRAWMTGDLTASSEEILAAFLLPVPGVSGVCPG